MEINISFQDRFGNAIQLVGVDEIFRFIGTEEESWNWTKSAPRDETDAGVVFHQHFQSLRLVVDRFRNREMDEQGVRNNFASLYGGTSPQLLLSDHWPGSAIRMIAHAFNDAEAVRALAYAVKSLRPDLSDLRDFRTWQLIANPNLLEAQSWLEDQKIKIASARSALRRQLDQGAAEYKQVISDLQTTIAQDRQKIRGLASQAIRLGNVRGTLIKREARSEVDQIQATKAAFEEQMRLKAPVQYWADKKDAHDGSAKAWLITLIVFLLVGAVLSGLLFHAAWGVVGDGALTGKHFLLAAGVGAVLTVLFWMARLIIRIYMGERHLATDAEERRVMTQAYLALIREKAASNEDRLVILTALFKSAQDGIVKDDGAGELSLPAMFAGLLARK